MHAEKSDALHRLLFRLSHICFVLLNIYRRPFATAYRRDLYLLPLTTSHITTASARIWSRNIPSIRICLASNLIITLV